MWRVLVSAAVVGAAAWGIWEYGEREGVPTVLSHEHPSQEVDLDAYFDRREADVPNLRAVARARIVWAGEPGARTGLALVYLHGFSASAEEIRPVPDRVAEALGANLIFTRLSGHGRDGAAMAEPRAGDWLANLSEAVAAGRLAGDRVILMGTSTGGTLAALAATDPDLAGALAGVVLISPNFRIANPMAELLGWPYARYWLPPVTGLERSFEPVNAGHAEHWTTSYPSVATLPLGALVAHTMAQDFSAATVPVLMLFSDSDQVVDHTVTRAVAEAWGGEATVKPVDLPETGVDPSHHVIAGDILSPVMNDFAIQSILDWVRALPDG